MSKRTSAELQSSAARSSKSPAREIAHALNNLTSVICSTVELLGTRTWSPMDQSLLTLLAQAAREMESLSSRVVALGVVPPAAHRVDAAGEMLPMRNGDGPGARQEFEQSAEVLAHILHSGG